MREPGDQIPQEQQQQIPGHVGYSPDYKSGETIPGISMGADAEVILRPGPHNAGTPPKSSLLENDRCWRAIVAAAQHNGLDNDAPDVGDLLAFFLGRFTPEAFKDWRGPA